MTTSKQKAKELLLKHNKRTRPKCSDTFFSVFDRLYIDEFGCCFECDGREETEKQKAIDAIIQHIETL